MFKHFIQDRKQSIWLLATLIWVFLNYANAWTNPFVYDDREYLQNAPGLEAYVNPVKAWRAQPTRPVLALTYAVSQSLQKAFDFKAPVFFHAMNLAIHLANVFLVYLLILALFRGQRRDGSTHRYAAMGALVFGLHPLQTEAVTYISGRSSSLVTFFILLCLWFWQAYLNEKKRKHVLLCLSALVLACLSKEVGVLIPAMLLIWMQVFTDQTNAGLRKRVYVLAAVFYSLVLAAVLLFRRAELAYYLELRPYSTSLFTSISVLPRYFGLFLWPFGRQSIDHQFALVHSVLSLRFLMGIGFLALLLVKAYALRRLGWEKTLHKFVYLGILFFLVPLSLNLVMPIDDLFSERWVYTSMFACSLLVVAALIYFESRLYAMNPGQLAKQACMTLAFLLLVLWSVATWQRNAVYASRASLWRDTAAKSPLKPRVQFLLGEALFQEHDYKDAAKAFEKSLALEPNYLPPRLSLAKTHAILEDDAQAMFHYQAFLRKTPKRSQGMPLYLSGLNHYVAFLMKRNREQDAEQTVVSILGRFPNDASIWRLLGQIRLDLAKQSGNDPSQLRAAQEALNKAWSLRGGDLASGILLAQVQTLSGQPEASLKTLNRLETKYGRDARVFMEKGNLYYTQGDLLKAAQAYEKAKHLAPNLPDPYFNLGMVSFKQGQWAEVQRFWKAFLEIEKEGPRSLFVRQKLMAINNTKTP